MIDGATSKAFSASTEAVKKHEQSFKNEVIKNSQKNYGRNRVDVEREIFFQKATVKSQTLFTSPE